MAGASHTHKGLSQGAWATHLDKLTVVDGLAKQVTHRCNLSRWVLPTRPSVPEHLGELPLMVALGSGKRCGGLKAGMHLKIKIVVVPVTCARVPYFSSLSGIELQVQRKFCA